MQEVHFWPVGFSDYYVCYICSSYLVFKDIREFLFKNLEMVIYYIWSCFSSSWEGYD